MIQDLAAIVQCAIDLDNREQPRVARYSCCMSTNTTIGTLDEFTKLAKADD